MMCISLSTYAQDENSKKGIQWTTGLSWEQVKQKAKLENKFIFLDCFATWCGPCKLMDKEVYTNDTVASFFNDKFISVRVQMDKTKNDNEYVKKWYKDADSINRYTDAYPTFLFVSKEGVIVYKGVGYKPSLDFVSLGQTAIKPGNTYLDPFKEYFILKDEYKQGNKHYDRMPYMIKTAPRFGDTAFARELLIEHIEYVSKLNPEQRYTKEAIQIWSEYTLKSSGLCFQFFYKDGYIIDQVMNEKGYAQTVVDKTIENELINPFYKKQPTGEIMFPHLVSLTEPIRKDHAGANWKELYKEIRKKFDKNSAKRNVLAAKINWYDKHGNMELYIKYFVNSLEKITKDSIGPRIAGSINHCGWQSFLAVNDLGLLKKIIPWTEKVAKKSADYFYLDTHANLLYKAGKKQEAIFWEERAVFYAKSESKKAQYRNVIEQMKRGEPTYLGSGTNWEGINSISWKGFEFSKIVSVKDINGKPIEGALVINNRTGESKQTTPKGFVVMEVSLDDILEISAKGYKSDKLPITKAPGRITVVL